MDKQNFLKTPGQYKDNYARESLDYLVGEIVGVWAGPGRHRNDFDLKINVSGELERHHEDKEAFRIVFSEGNYAYFEKMDVVEITINPGRFRDNAIACIKIKL